MSVLTGLDPLDAWVQAGWLREVDRAFAAFLAREAPDAHPLLLLAAALASHQLGRSHVCLDLRAALDDAGETLALPPEEDAAKPQPVNPLEGLRLPDWHAALRHAALVGTGPGNTPLVLVGDRLYLRRYWQHERTVREGIAQRLAQAPLLDASSEARLRTALDALFGSAADLFAPHDWQKTACALAARSRFAIITGGPGTGKTTTVVRLLAVLQSMALATGRPLRIRLAAPTGKAAARLNDSIARVVDDLPLHLLERHSRDPARHSRPPPSRRAGSGGNPERPSSPLRAAIPTEVTTVHRLLGSRPGTRHFHHHAHNLLPLDVLVLDEASMVDLEMMAAVLIALPPQARLILLGDKDQLASVEAGAVLGELCRRADVGHYLPATRDWLASVTGESVPDAMVDPAGQPLDQAVVKLRRSHRFDAASGIGQLAEAVNEGNVAALQALRAAPPADLEFTSSAAEAEPLRALVLGEAAPKGAARGYRHYLEQIQAARPLPDAPPAAFDAWASSILNGFGEFQLLCAVRLGPVGVQQVNLRVAAVLAQAGLMEAAPGWVMGRPVMVTRNDYALGLMNGDVGITLALPTGTQAAPWSLRVAFPRGQGGIRWVLPSRLQQVETAFAMTVHKSQGSEFAHAALLLPDRLNRVLTRELVYTAVTRARTRLTVAGDAQLLQAAIARRLVRSGGLLQAGG